MDALSDAALRALRLLGDHESQRVFTTVGPEQEYFLIDEQYYFERPDLVTTGRTLFGAKPPKGHELDDHYFGSIPERILACMLETEAELGQARRAGQDAPQRGRAQPVRDRARVRGHQRRLRPPDADDAGACRTSPAATASSACCTRSRSPASTARASTTTGRWAPTPATTCSSPGDTPHENLNFLLFAAAVIQAVDTHQQLLRASIASAGQDHRLGANEAPPAIISIFLGTELEGVFVGDRRGQGVSASKPGSFLGLGTPVLPPLPLHSGDRNRTSPFAFTGNKFEFRALGSSQSPSFPNTVLNTIVAEAIDELAEKLDAGAEGRREPREGDPRDRQGLLQGRTAGSSSTATTTPRPGTRRPRSAASPTCARRRTRCRGSSRSRRSALFKHYKVLSKRELEARYDVFIEQYSAKVNIEAETAASIARTLLLPAALRHLAELREAGVETPDRRDGRAGRASSSRRSSRSSSVNTPHPDVDGLHARALHARRGAARRWTACARSPTASSGSSPTTSGRCRKYSEMLFIK